MVNYLLNHRIAVIMTFLGLVIVGCITYATLPVSLLPDIAIPNISVQVTNTDLPSRELENTVTAPLRRQLMQTSRLSEIKSESRDGSAFIYLTFDYGTDTDLAFIEVNEKIDGAMTMLPKSTTRPKAIKASASDIPVVYLQLTSRENSDESFREMAYTAENIIRRRMEQLPEIAMTDMTGTPERVLKITPDQSKMAQAGITISDLESAVVANNMEPGSMTVRDGYYEYSIKVSNLLKSEEDIRKIKFRKGDRLFDFGDFADVEFSSRKPHGLSIHNGKRAVSMAIIKQSEENMDDLANTLETAIGDFTLQYPDIEFSLTRNQTELLDFTISNLKQNLLLGLILVFVICTLFMRGFRTSMIIGTSIVVALILTLLLFYLFHISLNIISLSGLILAVGMMIDNSVIVTDNITQHIHRGESLAEACAKGTNEMITPMLSSSLTTIAVFLPPVFMSGMAGAVFSNQAFSITAGLASSYITCITLLPVLYLILISKKDNTKAMEESGRLTAYYDRGMDWSFKHKWPLMGATVLMIPLCVWLFFLMRQERLPEIDSNETVLTVDWNENITLEENNRRVIALHDSAVKTSSAYLGVQDYMLDNDCKLSARESELYFQTKSPGEIPLLKERLADKIRTNYPTASFSFSKAGNIFDKTFPSDGSNLEVRIHTQAEWKNQQLIPLLFSQTS